MLWCSHRRWACCASMVQKLGVKISYAKSLRSATGCAEFTKILLMDELHWELSPVSVRCLMNSFSLLGLACQYDIKRFPLSVLLATEVFLVYVLARRRDAFGYSIRFDYQSPGGSVEANLWICIQWNCLFISSVTTLSRKTSLLFLIICFNSLAWETSY